MTTPSRSTRRSAWSLLSAVGVTLAASVSLSPAGGDEPVGPPEQRAGQPADIAPSAYQYRADRKPEENPPESWIALMKYANLALDKPVDVHAPALKRVLCGLLWEEVRPIRRVELVWSGDPRRRPKADQVVVHCFDAEVKGNIPTWWNRSVVRELPKPEIHGDGRVCVYNVPVDTFGLIVSVRGQREASAFEVPAVRAFVGNVWKTLDLEIQWGFDPPTAAADYSGRIEAYDGVLAGLRPLAGDAGTAATGPCQWRSIAQGDGRRGIGLSLLYLGTPQPRKVWPYNAGPEDVARTIVTVWTRAGNFSFQASDLENGPILAPEYGFYVRAVRTGPSMPAPAATAREFIGQLSAQGLTTLRQRVRRHPEATWDGSVAAMLPAKTLPPIPKPDLAGAMKVEVPCEKLAAQWNLGAWHLTRHCAKTDGGRLRFNDHPYGILASETYLILYALDLMGMHDAAADGLDQWLALPLENKHPVGLFSDGHGCLSHAVGPPGLGGNMDGIHSMGPGAIMLALSEHFRLTGDRQWLTAHLPRMKANVEWILRQRRLLAGVVPGGERLWCKGLQPAHQVTPDSGGQLMQFYESEAYYWLAVHNMADMLALVDPAEGAKMAAEAEAYRKDLLAAVERSIALSPVVRVRDGTYRSFIPFACYVRGFASGAWSWRRPGSGAHVGGLYWDTIQSAEPLVSPAALLPAGDPRVQGTLDVLEDRLLLENPKLADRTPGYDSEKHWFAHAGWQYQPGLERHAGIHLAGDDVPCFLRSWLNQYAVLIQPDKGYVFNEHTTRGPPDKIFEEAAFLERFRNMLVMDADRTLWLARATPRAWLEQGKRIAVRDAPTHFGAVDYEIVSDVEHGRISATIEMPSRGGQAAVLLRLRHPTAAPIKSVKVNGRDWKQFDAGGEVIRLEGIQGRVVVEAKY